MAESRQRHRRALKLHILLAALQVMTEALQFAAREGFIRSLTDEEPTVMRLVAEVRAAGMHASQGAAVVGAAVDIAPAFLDRILGGSAGSSPNRRPRRPAQYWSKP